MSSNPLHLRTQASRFFLGEFRTSNATAPAERALKLCLVQWAQVTILPEGAYFGENALLGAVQDGTSSSFSGQVLRKRIGRA